MLKVEGQRPWYIAVNPDGHLDGRRELVDAIVFGLVFRSALARDEEVHLLRQSRNGASSWCIQTASGREYHFRPAPGNTVAVFDSYRKGNQIGELHTRAHVHKFLRMVDRIEKG
jgi:hypothetical protein